MSVQFIDVGHDLLEVLSDLNSIEQHFSLLFTCSCFLFS